MLLIESIEVWKIRNPESEYFDSVEIDSRLDKKLLEDLILQEYSEMHVVHTNSVVMHKAVENLFKKYSWNIEKMLNALESEYDPINNYQLKEVRKLGRNESGTKGTNYEGEDERLVSAFNNEEYVKESKNTSTSDEYQTDESQTNEDETITKNGIVNGTYQELVEKELEIAKNNIYNFILAIFAKELLISQW